MKKYLLHIVFILLAMMGVKAQDTAFVSIIGGANHEQMADAVRIGNSYYLVAQTSSAGYGLSDVYVVKTDTMGSVQQTWMFGSEQLDQPTAATIIGDSLIAITGQTNRNFANGYDAFLLVIDTLGNVKTDVLFGGTDWDLAHAIYFDDYGHLLIAGETYSFGAGSSDAWLIKCKLDGSMIWQQTYGSTRKERFKKVMKFHGERYLLGGEFVPTGSNETDFVVMWTDTAGVMIDSVMWGGSGREVLNDLYLHTDMSLIITGATSTNSAGGLDFLLMHLDTTGQVFWVNTFGGPNDDEWKSALRSTGSLAMMCVGYSVSGIGAGGKEVFMYRYAIPGWFENLTTWGLGGDEEGIKVLPVPVNFYGALIVAGHTNSFDIGGDDLFLLRTRINGSATDSLHLDYTELEIFYTNMDESVVEVIRINSTSDGIRFNHPDGLRGNLFMFDMQGKLLFKQQSAFGFYVPASYLNNGVFLWQIESTEGAMVSGKIPFFYER